MSSVMDKLKKNSRIKDAAVLSEQKIFQNQDIVDTGVPMINIALSGDFDGGLGAGMTVLAGPSKHFKSNFALLMAKAYLDKHKDAILVFYDSEFGSKDSYFQSFGIDPERVWHVPATDIEKLKFDLVHQLDELDRKDHVIIVIDSVGNISSKKELEDALSEKSVADMSRAKALKGLFRMVTPLLTMKDIPLIAINHTYKEMGLFPKDVVSGGCVVEGTEIQTQRGLVEIQDVQNDDIIITQYGDKEVKALWNPDTLDEGNPECFEMEFEDGYKVTCSADHKFIVDGKWVSAKNLIVNMDCETI